MVAAHFSMHPPRAPAAAQLSVQRKTANRFDFKSLRHQRGQVSGLVPSDSTWASMASKCKASSGLASIAASGGPWDEWHCPMALVSSHNCASASTHSPSHPHSKVHILVE